MWKSGRGRNRPSGVMNPIVETSGCKTVIVSAIRAQRMGKETGLLREIIKILDLLKVPTTKVKVNFVHNIVQKVTGYFAL